MTAENPERVLNDTDDSDDDETLVAGAMTLLVAAVVTVVIVGRTILGVAVGTELYVLAGTIWLLGTALRGYEVKCR